MEKFVRNPDHNWSDDIGTRQANIARAFRWAERLRDNAIDAAAITNEQVMDAADKEALHAYILVHTGGEPRSIVKVCWSDGGQLSVCDFVTGITKRLPLVERSEGEFAASSAKLGSFFRHLQHSLQVAVRLPAFVADVHQLLPDLPDEEPEDFVGSAMDWNARGLVPARHHSLP